MTDDAGDDDGSPPERDGTPADPAESPDSGQAGESGSEGAGSADDDPTPDESEDAPTPDGSSDDPTPDESDDATRRWFIRIMIAIAIGLPIAIEFRTLVGLIQRAFGGGDDGGDTTTTTDFGGVGVGDDLLPATEQTERVADAFVSTAGSGRTLTLAVAVENPGDRPYRLRLGDLRTDGDVVPGESVTDPVPPGGSTSVVARWSLPAGATPREVRVEGEYVTDGTVVETVGEWVPLARVPTR